MREDSARCGWNQPGMSKWVAGQWCVCPTENSWHAPVAAWLYKLESW